MKKILLSIFAVMLAVFSVQAEEIKYSFSSYETGTQYAQGERHTLDENVTLIINGAHLNEQVRLYAGSNAVFESKRDITKVVLNAGNKAGTLTVNVSDDGSTWTKVKEQTTTTSYTAYTFDLGGSYKYVQMVSTGAQIRVSIATLTFSEDAGGEGGETPEEPETPVEPEIPVTPEEPEFLTPGEYTDVLTIESIGVKSYPSYTSWSDVKLNSAAVYAGLSHKNNNSIQLRTTNSNSGIVTTVSGGKAKKVSIEWQDQNNTRTLNIYGKNTPYESPADLYDTNKQGTKLGSITGGNNRSTELTISGDYKYIGLRSNSGALYLNSIEIIWEVEPASYTLAVGETRYSTLSLGYDAAIPQGAKAYVVSEVNGGYVTLEEVTGVIPAKEAVIIEATPGNYNFVQTTEGAAVVGENLLEGTRVDTYVAEEAYVLWNVDGDACFCKADMTNGSFLNKANKAYLPASAVPANVKSLSFRFGEGTTGISEVKGENGEVKAIFDLTGRRIEAITAPGIYIVNGKKVLVK
jgi:hypothetical protein